MSQVANIVVDVSLDRTFDYRIPDGLKEWVQVGSYVVVPFGRRKARGFVVSIRDHSDFKSLKDIDSLVSKKSLIDDKMMELASWMADYYVAPIEAAVRTILPSAVRRTGAKFKEQLTVAPTEKASDESVLAPMRKKAPKQVAVLDVLNAEAEMPLAELVKVAQTTSATVRALEKKGLVRVGSQRILRDPHAGHKILPTKPLELEPQQVDALKVVVKSIDDLDPPVVLLHGVTGSGKTEIYLQGIQHALDQGKGAIVLVPEIALTPQMVERFVSRFGETIAVLHSHLSTGERHDEWHRIHSGKARIAIGARSALFAPVHNLGLIVVDEEHEHTYKQDEAPRYNARDVAVLRGRNDGCAVVLGSATPSLESYKNGLNGKYRLIGMPHRVDHRQMPVIRVVDMRTAKNKDGALQVLSPELVEAIQQRLDRTEQVMLFMNRRGFATSLVCKKCGYVAECSFCSVAMTYHKTEHNMRCHICGESSRVPACCPEPNCGDPEFKYSGMGIQRVEEVVGKVFPRAKVQRMDSDTTSRKGSHARFLSSFRRGDVDILLGTQMIAKGLHFPNVTLVGVVYADTMLHMPDFRAGERTFQLLTQVAGRAGRGDVPGEVIVQTFTPHNESVQAARRMDFDGFADQELEFRRQLFYPPYCHLITVMFRGPAEEVVSYLADHVKRKLEAAVPESVRVAGPAPAPIARAKGLFRYHILIRSESVIRVSRPLREILAEINWPDKISYTVDVDALSIM